MPVIVHPVSSDDKEKLYQYARKWQDLLSLHRWRITPSNQQSTAMAEVKFDSDNSHKLARLLVGKHFGSTPVDDESLEMTALHEMLHVFLHEFKESCKESPYDETRQMEAEHSIIHVLEKLLYELWHCKHAELPEKPAGHRPTKQRA